MRETWIVVGAWWKLPIWADWVEQEDVATVTIGGGMNLLGIQKKELTEFLDKFCEKKNESLFCLRTILTKFAYRSDKENKEEEIVWNPPTDAQPFRPAQINAAKPFQSEFYLERCAAREELFALVCKEGFFKSHEQAEVFYNAFCKAMLHMLVNREKLVDLGFCQLHSLPYRKNWKEITLHKMDQIESRIQPFLPPEDWVKPDHLWYEFIDNMNFAFIENSSTVEWNLEVYTMPMWNEMVRRVEAKKKQSVKWRRYSYLKIVRETLFRKLKTIRRIYDQYLAKVRLPAVRIFPSDRLGVVHRELERSQRMGEVLEPPRFIKVPVHFDNRPGAASKSGVVDLSEEAEKWLREMSDLLQEESNLRKKGGDVEEPKNGET